MKGAFALFVKKKKKISGENEKKAKAYIILDFLVWK